MHSDILGSYLESKVELIKVLNIYYNHAIKAFNDGMQREGDTLPQHCQLCKGRNADCFK